MKRQVLAFAVASLFALPALANYELYGNGIAPQVPVSSKSRADVRAELVAAQRSGEVIAIAETGERANQLDPSRYPALVAAGKSRAEVLAELADSRRSGNYIVNAETGQTARELFPHEYGHTVVAGK